MEKLKNLLYEEFNLHNNYDDIIDDLRSLNSSGELTDEEYNTISENYSKWLEEWASRKETNTYKFLNDLIYDITEDNRTNQNKKYDFDKTIENLIDDDEFWQNINDLVWKNLVEIKEEV